MKKLHLYFDRSSEFRNGLTDYAIQELAAETNLNPGIFESYKRIYRDAKFKHTKDIFWTEPDGSEPYFYPVSVLFALNDYSYQNRYTGYSFIEIPKQVVDDCVAKKAAILLYETWEADTWWDYNEMITDICRNNERLMPSHFIVTSCNVNMPPDIPYKHIGLNWYQKILQPNVDVEQIKSQIKSKTLRDHKFLMMSRRPAEPRLALLYHLWEYRDQGSMSFDHWDHDKSFNFERMQSRTTDVFKIEFDTYKMNIINDHLPLRLDDGIDPRLNPVYDTSGDKFLNSHLHIVPETFFNCDQHYGLMFFSEKVFKPMQYLQPFVLMNYPQSLVALRKDGYETFSEWIDESYDTIDDPAARMNALVESIINFIAHDKKTLTDIHCDMLPVLEHNFYQRKDNAEKMLIDFNNQVYEQFYRQV